MKGLKGNLLATPIGLYYRANEALHLRFSAHGLDDRRKPDNEHMNANDDGFTILVVDDSPVARKLVEYALPPDQFRVLLAKTGGEALDLFAKHRPPVVITDWLMPDLSGIELCQRIRAEFRDSFTYIILLTGVSEKLRVVKGLEAGADDYLTKPFNSDELLARIGVGRRTIKLHQEIEAKNRLLEQLALTDALTGLPNRRAIEDWAMRQLSGAARHGFPFWVIMADLDNFKSVNDSYGHDAGDAVLKKFAEILKVSTRQCDISGRIGGEEFLLVVTYSDRKGVQLAIERIREQFEAHKFIFNGQALSVTASFGMAGYQEGQPPSFDRLAAQADAALYSAKRLGRNRVEIASLETLAAKPL
jgi:two-component system cell cycle response regulator